MGVIDDLWLRQSIMDVGRMMREAGALQGETDLDDETDDEASTST